MTTTDVFQGMDEGAKPSSRVLAPPGGGSSDIFGTGIGTAPPEAPRTGKGCQGNSRNQSSILGGGGDDGSTQARQRNDDRSGSNIFGAPDPKPNPPARAGDNIFGPPTTQNQTPKSSGKGQEEDEDDEEAENKKPARNTRGGVNPITGATLSGSEDQGEETSKTAKPRAGVNPITGEAYGQPKKDVHTSISVKQPPGGASSGLW